VIMVAGFFFWRGADFALRPWRAQPALGRAKDFMFRIAGWQIDSYAMHAGLLIVMFRLRPAYPCSSAR